MAVALPTSAWQPPAVRKCGGIGNNYPMAEAVSIISAFVFFQFELVFAP